MLSRILSSVAAFRPALSSIRPFATASHIQTLSNSAQWNAALIQSRTDHIPLVVDFSAAWYDQCPRVDELLEKAAVDPRIRVLRVDVDKCPQLARELGVSEVPHVRLVFDEKVEDRFTGLPNDEVMLRLLRHAVKFAEMEKKSEKLFVYKDRQVAIRHSQLTLRLRATFGTSHSSSTQRTNSLIEIALPRSSVSGYGEIGLPPKKPGCYLANTTDIAAWLAGLGTYIDSIKDSAKVPEMKIAGYRVPDEIAFLFHAMETCPENVKEYSVAARNGFECALYDLLGKVIKKPVYSLLFPGQETFERPCFYSLGIGPEAETINNIKFALKRTQYIKVKLNRDVTRAEHMFDLLDRMCRAEPGYSGKWAADMNTDGSVEVCWELLNRVFKKYKGRFYMLEQPFPLHVDPKDFPRWKAVKDAYEKEGFLIYADESISNAASILKMKDIVSGVNVKLEKCGGFRGALQCVETAHKLGLKIWVGIMVGTSVLSSMAAMLSPVSEFDDCAGDLLVSDESQPFEDGFVWDLKKGVIRSNLKPGIGVELKKSTRSK